MLTYILFLPYAHSLDALLLLVFFLQVLNLLFSHAVSTGILLTNLSKDSQSSYLIHMIFPKQSPYTLWLVLKTLFTILHFFIAVPLSLINFLYLSYKHRLYLNLITSIPSVTQSEPLPVSIQYSSHEGQSFYLFLLRTQLLITISSISRLEPLISLTILSTLITFIQSSLILLLYLVKFLWRFNIFNPFIGMFLIN